jgi:hypothetical protein
MAGLISFGIDAVPEAVHMPAITFKPEDLDEERCFVAGEPADGTVVRRLFSHAGGR